MIDMVIVAVLLNFWSCDIGLGSPLIFVFKVHSILLQCYDPNKCNLDYNYDGNMHNSIACLY